MASKAAKLRARRNRGTVASMTKAWEKETPNPEREQDPRIVVLSARARHMARPIGEIDHQIWGEPAGQAIAIGSVDKAEADRLWAAFKKVDMADDAYMRRIIGKHRFPNVSKAEFLPESFETNPDDVPDNRTADEKDRDAVNGWMRMQGLLGCLAGHERHSIASIMRRRVDPVKGGQLTTAGLAFVAAIRMLDERMNKR
ncbi:hypothetical protein [Paracoccus sp. (in: a-proteobacteria)]|uniref:hypothetical protein n=1 Tax=Paracoccus sp. TaxID=267 RepID=UPI00289D5883|nr:hypothetical protein [Paracoccus sp. (in: a-proteobacteria)]